MSRHTQKYFVLDCSVTMGWCFEDEASKYTDLVLNCFESSKALVPTLWTLEVTNVLVMAERKKRISSLQSNAFLDVINSLPIEVDSSTPSRAFFSLTAIARKTNLTIYDSAYLEIALRNKIPIATFDKALRKAATHLKIELLS